MVGHRATATVRGVVRDTSGAVLPGAAVTVTNVDTGSTRATRSSPDGSFQVASLTPGRYRVAISRDRFAPTHQDIELSADQVLLLTLTLALAPQAHEDVTVVAGERTTIAGNGRHLDILGEGVYRRHLGCLPDENTAMSSCFRGRWTC
jgi:hypothetical protein